MRYLKLALLIFSVFALAGCAEFGLGHRDSRYAQHAKTIPEVVVPPGAQAPKISSFYPVPHQVDKPTQPSIVPPGSHFQHDIKSRRSQASNGVQLTQSQSISTVPALKIAVKEPIAWQILNRALLKTQYKVLDEDPSVGVFYILDMAPTDGEITADTPIYQVNVKPSGKDTRVTLTGRDQKPLSQATQVRFLNSLSDAIKTT